MIVITYHSDENPLFLLGPSPVGNKAADHPPPHLPSILFLLNDRVEGLPPFLMRESGFFVSEIHNQHSDGSASVNIWGDVRGTGAL